MAGEVLEIDNIASPACAAVRTGLNSSARFSNGCSRSFDAEVSQPPEMEYLIAARAVHCQKIIGLQAK